MLFNLLLPPTDPTTAVTELQNDGIVVIVGANGTGKSRYGAWLEFDSELRNKVRRVSAQRVLSFPESIVTGSIESAKQMFEYGASGTSLNRDYRKLNRAYFNNKPATHPMNDYENLLKLLFSEEQEVAVRFRHEAMDNVSGDAPLAVPHTKLDSIKEIWDSVHTHRKLVISGGKVEVMPVDNNNVYNASNMSDGERVSFYLIGQCLLAEPNGIILLDEPELHLNRNIQSKLWNAIEAARKDCQFVYLTHDLDFAASRSTAKKIWFKEYKRSVANSDNGSESGSTWKWEEIPQDTGIPDELILTVIGSRKPILFVEGDKSSYDFLIYDHYYKDHTIIPRGGCTEVIASTKGFNNLPDLHTLACKGLIDRDYRTDEQVSKLTHDAIYAIGVSEVENLLLTEEILQVIEKSLYYKETESKILEAKRLVLTMLDTEKGRVIGSIARSKLNAQLPTITDVYEDKSTFTTALNALTTLDLNSIYESAEKVVNDVLTQNNYTRALEIFDNEGLVGRVASLYCMKKTGFLEHFRRLIGTEHDEAIRKALGKYLPAV